MKKRPLFDAEGRIFGLISVVDILAVLVVLALAVMLIGRFTSAPTSHYGNTDGQGSSNNAKMTCELRLSGVRKSTIDAIQPGDVLHDPETGNVLGTVTAVRQEPYFQLVETYDGRVLELETEDYIVLYLTLEGTGTVVDGHCYLSGAAELVHNAGLSFVTPYVNTVGTLVSFSYEVGA